MQVLILRLAALTAPPRLRLPPFLAQAAAALLTLVEGWGRRIFGTADDDIGWDDGEPESRR